MPHRVSVLLNDKHHKAFRAAKRKGKYKGDAELIRAALSNLTGNQLFTEVYNGSGSHHHDPKIKK